jgi:flagellar motility protein MotE (MotC chaperone)
MTNEEIQRTMEFIIKQQENFTVQMERLSESHTRGEARLSRLEAAFVTLYNTVSETAKAQKELAEAQKEFAATQNRTDERLNNLITVVEQFLSERNNGKSES